MAAEGGSQMIGMFVRTVKEDPIMWPILILGLIVGTVAIERVITIFLEKRHFHPLKFLDEFYEKLRENGGDKIKTVDQMVTILEAKACVFSAIALAAFHKFKDGMAKAMTPIEIRKWMADTVETTASAEVPRLDTRLIALAVIANVATLMGLFGTVMGMIDSFTAMSNSPGGVKADEMAGGIATALIATALGLFVAVPALILYNAIKGHIENHVAAVEESVYKIIDVLSE